MSFFIFSWTNEAERPPDDTPVGVFVIAERGFGVIGDGIAFDENELLLRPGVAVDFTRAADSILSRHCSTNPLASAIDSNASRRPRNGDFK